MNYRERIHTAHRLEHVFQNMSWPTHFEEPDYVAKMMTTLPIELNNVLSQTLPGRRISVGSAFIHQKPLAHFVNRVNLKDPELGDMLFVCREKKASGYVYNAMLLQAKCVTNPLRALIPVDHQFVLYSEWPEFEYRKAGILNGKRRSVLPKSISQGAQYLLIDKTDPNKWYTATVNRVLSASSCFSWTLSSILSFDEGRTFMTTPHRDMWSQMIIDLMQIASSSKFKRKNSGYSNANRLSGDRAFSIMIESNRFEYAEEASMGIICIDMGEREEDINR